MKETNLNLLGHFKKKLNSLFLIFYASFKEESVIKKLKNEKSLKEIESLNNNILLKNPAVVFFRSKLNLEKGKIEKGYNDIEDFEETKYLWEPKKKFNFFLKNQIIPSCRITGSFGNYRTVFAYLYNRINIQKIFSKPKIFIKKYDKITNFFLFRFFKPFLNFNQNSFSYFKNINKIYYHKTPIEITLPYKNKYYPWPVTENLINQHRQKNKNLKFNYFKIEKNYLNKGRELLKKHNLDKYKWYVALHVRESKISDDQSFRNVNPKNYLKSVKKIISKGGLVFRIGNKSMTPLPKLEGLIDYPFSNLNSEFMDIFLAATSKFVIGTSSGFWTAASFFKTPILITNYLPFMDYYSFNHNSIFLPKTVLNEKNQIISIGESYSIKKIGYTHTSKQFLSKKLKVLENTEDEILVSVDEMLNLVSGNNKEKKDFIHLNKKFKNIFFKNNFYNKNRLLPLAHFSSSYINKYL